MENIEKKELGNLAEAVIKVMQDERVRAMEKTSRIGQGDFAYDGTKDSDVKEVFNAVLAENGLCILPVEIQESTKIDRWQDGTKQKQSVFTKVTTKYLLLHDSGESIVLTGYGHGIDPQDKGAGKATTYALKNCLLYTFLTPVSKIDDTDQTHSKDISTPQNIKKDKTSDKQPQQPKPVKKELTELIKDSPEWKALMKFFEEGKVTRMHQVTKKFKVDKDLLKILQVMIDDSANEKILAEQLAKEAGETTENVDNEETDVTAESNISDTVKTPDNLSPKTPEDAKLKAEGKPYENRKGVLITPDSKLAEEKKVEKTSVRRLPALTNPKFEEAKKGTKAEILKVLAEHRMSKDQREELTALTKK